ncbi:MAG: hypothetical protein JXR95_16155 [Deltaproteobacteria bacterium]|nr:hypothetical protein [Deltaproteobacteria bacterium]
MKYFLWLYNTKIILVAILIGIFTSCDYLEIQKSDLSAWCSDYSGNFHFKALSPPMVGDAETLWNSEYEITVFKSVVSFGFADLGDIASSMMGVISYSDISLENAFGIFSSWVESEGYCSSGCTESEFELGDNSGLLLKWIFEDGGYLWYSNDYFFVRDNRVWHLSIHSIRNPNSIEYLQMVKTFTPGPPPESNPACQSPADVLELSPTEIFGEIQ